MKSHPTSQKTYLFPRQLNFYSKIKDSKVISLLLFLTIITFILNSCTNNHKTNNTSKKLENIKITSDFKPREIEEWTLDNGLTVMYIQDDELPLIQGSLIVRGGSYLESKDNFSSTGLMGSLLRYGGTKSYTPDKLDKELDYYSASIDSSFTGENGSITFKCLSSDIDKIFPIFSEVILSPRFDKERFELLRSASLEGILRRKDNPLTIASITFNQFLYDSSVYGKSSTKEEIHNITIKKIINAYSSRFSPERSILAITGNLKRDKLEELLNKNLSSWKQKTNLISLEYPNIEKFPSPKIYFIESNFAQSTIITGQLGAERLNPDHFPILMFNEVLGSGGMSSRLSTKVRTEYGLAYDIQGGVGLGLKKGKTNIILQTKAESTGVALAESFKILQELRDNEIPQDELIERKAGIINSFVFANENPSNTLFRQVLFKIYNYPKKF